MDWRSVGSIPMMVFLSALFVILQLYGKKCHKKMEEALLSIRTMSAVEGEWKALATKLIEKYDIFVSAASTMTGSETCLLSTIRGLMKRDYSLAVIILLNIQSENLPSACSMLFVEQVKHIFSIAHKEQVALVPKEGKMWNYVFCVFLV